MFDHVGIVVADLGAARAFYTATLSALGLSLLQDNSADDGTGWLVFGTQPNAPFFVVSCGQPGFWANGHTPSQSPVHLAFTAPAKEAVNAFYRAGLAQGGQDNGAPGPRGDGYYAAYVIDPDGNNIEAGYRG